MSSRPYRLRLMNLSNDRFFKLGWNDGRPLTVIGSGGGLLERPIEKPYVMLGPAERVDVWADFSADPVGTELEMLSLPFLTGPATTFSNRLWVAHSGLLVFPGLKGGVRDGRRLSRTFKRHLRLCGLPDNLHWHSLRHTFASWLASSGVPIATIQRWMGHASIEQTMVYADLLPSALRWQGGQFHERILGPEARVEAGKGRSGP